MDKYGSIHAFDDDERKALLEKLNGPLVPIDPDKLEEVSALNRAERRKWYREQQKLAKARDR
jgi:hypothetical protein